MTTPTILRRVDDAVLVADTTDPDTLARAARRAGRLPPGVLAAVWRVLADADQGAAWDAAGVLRRYAEGGPC